MLCPVCLRHVATFTEEEVDGVPLLSCPHRDCSYGIPLTYRDDYATHPPLTFSLIGLTGHGKTIFKGSLLQEIEKITTWPGFYYNWLDEIVVRVARQSLHELGLGQLPDATTEQFQPPHILRLSEVPRLGGCQLLIFDCSGEVWLDGIKIRDGGRFVRNSPSVIWLISLTDLKSPADLNDMLDIYLHALATMKVNPQEQSIVFTLTKGDLLLLRPDFPELARHFLYNDDLDPRDDSWQRLQAVSDVLEEWLANSGFQKVVNTAKSRFRTARYCVVSALGAPAGQQQTELEVMPRGVLAPLFWAWRLQRSAAWLNDERKRTLYFSLPDALAEAPDGATIELEAEEYRVAGALSIRRPVRIVGAGMLGTKVIAAAEKWGVGIGADGTVSFQDFTIEVEEGPPADVVRVVRGRFDAVGCRFRGGTADERHVGSGLVLAGESSGTIADSIFAGNQRHGLVVRDRAQFRVERCRALNNGLTGIYCESLAVNLLVGNDCTANRHGIWSKGAGEFIIEDNHCHHNGKTGLRLENAQGFARENRLVSNGEAGLEVAGVGQPTVARNSCESNAEHGILIAGEVLGVFEENECRSNKASGIRVSESARPILVKNRCAANALHGIHIDQSAAGECRENACEHNGEDGIRVDGAAAPELVSNQCEANTADGIGVLEQAKPALEQNTCHRNGRNGMTLGKGAKPRSLKRNTADGNAGKPVNDLRPWI